MGNLEIHTSHTMDAAARIADREGLKGDDRATIVFAAMLHDCGKPSTTSTNDRGEIISHGHDSAGEPIARKFLESIGIKKDIVDRVTPLVREHMQHVNFIDQDPSSRIVRRLAERLYPATIKELGHLAEADHSGRPPLPGGMPPGMQKLLDKASESHVTEKPMDRLVQGRDVMPYFGNEPGPHIGEVVKDAYEAQMNGEISTPEDGQDWLKKRFSKTAAMPKRVGMALSKAAFERAVAKFGPYAYHDTPDKNIDSILAAGILPHDDPRNPGKRTWGDEFIARPGHVYLHTGRCPSSPSWGSKEFPRRKGDMPKNDLTSFLDHYGPCPIRIDLRKLDLSRFDTDEDIAHWSLSKRSDPSVALREDCNYCEGLGFNRSGTDCKRCNGSGIKREWSNLGEWAEDQPRIDQSKNVEHSMSKGLLAFKGRIPKKAIDLNPDWIYYRGGSGIKREWSNLGEWAEDEEEKTAGWKQPVAGSVLDQWVDHVSQEAAKREPTNELEAADAVQAVMTEQGIILPAEHIRRAIERSLTHRFAHGENEHEWFNQETQDELHYHDYYDSKGNGWSVEPGDYLINDDIVKTEGNDKAEYGRSDKLAWQHEMSKGFTGDAWKDCEACEGQGGHSCNTCDGARLTKADTVDICDRCRGKGIIDAGIVCIPCIGSGLRIKKKLCPDCKGEGTFDCKRCAGEGARPSNQDDIHEQIHEHQDKEGFFPTIWHYKSYGANEDIRPCRHGDPPQSIEKSASWRDVRNKGVRLRNAGRVNIILLDEQVVAADVGGDHGTYHVVLYRQDPDSWAISMWECSCKWGDWAFRRQHTYVGRMCSHALATLYEAHGKEYQKTAHDDYSSGPEIDEDWVKVEGKFNDWAHIVSDPVPPGKLKRVGMAVVPEERLPTKLRGTIQSFRQHPNVHHLTNPDTAGGHCQIASADFAAHARRRGHDAKVVYLQSREWPDEWHCITQVDRHYVDWTARQYTPWEEADVPRVFTQLPKDIEQIDHNPRKGQPAGWTIKDDRNWMPLPGFRLTDMEVDPPQYRIAAFTEHDPHDILDEKLMRRHLLRKHNDDPDFAGAINRMKPEDMQELHDDDHLEGMLGSWGKEWDDDEFSHLDLGGGGWKQKQKQKQKPYKPKTADEYIKGVEPSPRREGDDFDYDTRWFNHGLNADVLDTVKHLSDSYPVTKDWFKGVHVSDFSPSPCVVSNDHKIWLPPSFLDKPGTSMPVRGGTNSLIAHEFGHVLQASILKDSVGEDAVPDRDIHDLLTGNYSDSDLAHPDSPATYLMEHAKSKFPGEHISPYAETNQRERFAEAMRKHWLDPKEGLDKQSEFIGANVDFLYHRDGAGWKSRQTKTASSWFGRLIVDPGSVVASTSRAALKVYSLSGRITRFRVEVSETSESIRQGLMNRPSLPRDEGMVFLYPMPPSHSGFWMRSTLIPLSIAFWDQMGRIIEIKDMEPCRPGSDCPIYRCSRPYWGAVEVNRGLFQQYEIKPGDRVELTRG